MVLATQAAQHDARVHGITCINGRQCIHPFMRGLHQDLGAIHVDLSLIHI